MHFVNEILFYLVYRSFTMQHKSILLIARKFIHVNHVICDLMYSYAVAQFDFGHRQAVLKSNFFFQNSLRQPLFPHERTGSRHVDDVKLTDGAAGRTH